MIEVFGQIALAALLGAAIGVERKLAHKTAGIRTFALVALGACLFSIISKYAFQEFWGVPGFDPSRIASQVVVGIGFIGAGAIIFHQEGSRVRGLTTAAGLWVSAAIGMAVGYRLYGMAAMATLLTVLILVLLWFFEQRVLKRLIPVKYRDDGKEQDISG